MALEGMSRRALLKSVGIALAALPASVLVPSSIRTMALARAREILFALSPEEAETLKAVVGRIIPADENGPGAAEARADRYIDRALAGALKSLRPAYSAGLKELNAYARSAKGLPFAELAAADQDAVLAEIQADRASGFTGGSAQFFNLVRTHTIQGTFSDPHYGGNADFIGWDLIGYPGARTAVNAEYQRMGVKLAPNHKSAYDFGMFSKAEL